MSDGITDSYRRSDDYWKNRHSALVEENRKLERRIKRLELKLKKGKKK